MRIRVPVFLLLILIVAGCSNIGNVRRENPEDQYEVARSLYDRGKYYHAGEAFRLMLFNFSGVSYIDSVQYYLGMCYFHDEDYILAASEFRRLVKNFAQSSLADDGQLMIGKCYFLASPENVGLDQTDTYTAISEFENFVEDFPNSDLIPEANELLRECRGKIAKKEYKTGEQYFRMGMNGSARVYLEHVVTDSESLEWRGRSLYILAEIDEKEEKYDDAVAKLTNFLQAFPGHEWENKAKSKLEKIKSLSGGSVASDS